MLTKETEMPAKQTPPPGSSWSRHAGSTAEKNVACWKKEHVDNVRWLYEMPSGMPSIFNCPVKIHTAGTEGPAGAVRYQWLDGSAIVARPSVWYYAVHRDLVDTAQKRINALLCSGEDLAPAPGWPARPLRRSDIHGNSGQMVLPEDIGEYLEAGIEQR